MSNTLPNLALPLLMPSQAQKHVTHNEALQILDTLVQLSVTSAAETTPPAVPEAGARYLLPSGASGAWAGQAGRIASADEAGTWHFLAPRRGWLTYVADTGAMMVYDGTDWQPISGGPMQILNRAVGTDDTGLVLQTGHVTHALAGLFGSDTLRFAVSPDGVSFKDGVLIDSATGIADQPNLPRFSGATNYDNFCDVTDWIKIGINDLSYNAQNCFDAGTNLFTAPVDGTYHLGGHLLYKKDASSNARMGIQMVKNGTDPIPGSFGRVTSNMDNLRTVIDSHALVVLKAGDTVELQGMMQTNPGYFAANETTFWGFKVG